MASLRCTLDDVRLVQAARLALASQLRNWRRPPSGSFFSGVEGQRLHSVELDSLRASAVAHRCPVACSFRASCCCYFGIAQEQTAIRCIAQATRESGLSTSNFIKLFYNAAHTIVAHRRAVPCRRLCS